MSTTNINYTALDGRYTKPADVTAAIAAQPELVTTNTASGTAVTIGSTGVTDVTLTGNATITFPSLPAAGVAKTFMLVLRQDATGARTVTWPTVKWAGGLAPVLSSTAGKVDVFSFTSIDATNWLGFIASLDMR